MKRGYMQSTVSIPSWPVAQPGLGPTTRTAQQCAAIQAEMDRLLAQLNAPTFNSTPQSLARADSLRREIGIAQQNLQRCMRGDYGYGPGGNPPRTLSWIVQESNKGVGYTGSKPAGLAIADVSNSKPALLAIGAVVGALAMRMFMKPGSKRR